MTGTFRFKLDENFYHELHERLRRRQEEERNAVLETSKERSLGFSFFQRIRLSTLVAEKIPSVAMLKDLIETAFWTSLAREEGRELRFTIKYVDEAGLGNLQFREAIDFDVKNLRTLAPALSNLEVGVSASDGKLRITEISNLILEPFSIKVLDPGLVIVSLDYWNIAVITGDEPVFIRNALLSWSNDIWSIFAPNGGSFYSFSDLRVRTVIAIARQMRLRGHGGTLLIAPVNTSIEESISEIRYEVNRDNQVASEPLRELMEARKKTETNREDKVARDLERVWERELSTTVPEFIAQLTLVDGAAVLSADFDVLGFGVRLKPATKSSPSRIVRVDPLEHETEFETPFNTLPGGTRHKSAAQFIFDNRSSLAIVVSQDGNVTAFLWRTPSGSNIPCLHAFERLELTLF